MSREAHDAAIAPAVAERRADISALPTCGHRTPAAGGAQPLPHRTHTAARELRSPPAMLRINVTARPDGTMVSLEGRVVAAWLDALRTCWHSLRAAHAGPIRVNLDGVTFVDAAGKALLRAMQADGAVLMATTLMMRAVVEEIATARAACGNVAARRPAQR